MPVRLAYVFFFSLPLPLHSQAGAQQQVRVISYLSSGTCGGAASPLTFIAGSCVPGDIATSRLPGVYLCNAAQDAVTFVEYDDPSCPAGTGYTHSPLPTATCGPRPGSAAFPADSAVLACLPATNAVTTSSCVGPRIQRRS